MILLAVVLVLAYLVTRPHLGHTWYLYTSDLNSTAGPQISRPGFLTEKECRAHADNANAAPGTHRFATECRPNLELLWGW